MSHQSAMKISSLASSIISAANSQYDFASTNLKTQNLCNFFFNSSYSRDQIVFIRGKFHFVFTKMSKFKMYWRFRSLGDAKMRGERSYFRPVSLFLNFLAAKNITAPPPLCTPPRILASTAIFFKISPTIWHSCSLERERPSWICAFPATPRRCLSSHSRWSPSSASCPEFFVMFQ